MFLNTRLHIFFVLLLSSCFLLAQQNLKENFRPLRSVGKLPVIFTQNIREIVKQDITNLKTNKEKDKSIKSDFLTGSNYQIEHIVKSGSVLINDEVTIYLNAVVDVILKDNKELRDQLHIYTLKSSVVNAYTYDKGYIFVDIGLIAQAETEAQLAYILCHEISHYVKKHNINIYVNNEKIDRKNYNGGSKEDKWIEKCQYSKESESEADLEGFKLFQNTNYDLKQAEKAFDVLQYSHLPFELVEFKSSFLETGDFVLPKYYFLKEVSPIKVELNEDDSKYTHPNTTKRKQAISDLISGKDNSRVTAIVGSDRFEYIRDLSRMELCRLYLIKRDYPNAFYAAYILSKKYPSNEYLSEVISKCLYSITLYNKGIAHYTSSSYLENGIPNYANIESYPQQVYHLINKMPGNEWLFMSLNYVYRVHKKFPKNKTIEALSDSLFNQIKSTNWGIADFARTNEKKEIKKEVNRDSANAAQEGLSKTDLISHILKSKKNRRDDTVYYRNAFVDLFMNDKEFAKKFPATSDFSESNSGFTSYQSKSGSGRNKRNNLKKTESKIEKVLLVEPVYYKFDGTKNEELQYVTSDEKQEKFMVTINTCAKKLDFQIVTLDPGLITADDVDKLNDYSTLNDWFYERFDSEDEKQLILNTNDMDALVNKYSTKYILKMGIVTVNTMANKKETYFFGFLFDIKQNEMVYKKYELFNIKDQKELVNAKVYQTMFDLKNKK